mmetsp:Transcript_19853/g.32395  ORF Transcript_19853/g.32395 Transcript_19853/m.32395 type:complete len:87 (+) Transcript_19853:347-607(+)
MKIPIQFVNFPTLGRALSLAFINPSFLHKWRHSASFMLSQTIITSGNFCNCNHVRALNSSSNEGSTYVLKAGTSWSNTTKPIQTLH